MIDMNSIVLFYVTYWFAFFFTLWFYMRYLHIVAWTFFYLSSPFFILFSFENLQMEPVPSGNLPPGFDTSSCRSVWVLDFFLLLEFIYLFLWSLVLCLCPSNLINLKLYAFSYVGNIHVNVTDKLLAEVFQSAGPLAGCKLIRKEKVWFSIQFGVLGWWSLFIFAHHLPP